MIRDFARFYQKKRYDRPCCARALSDPVIANAIRLKFFSSGQPLYRRGLTDLGPLSNRPILDAEDEIAAINGETSMAASEPMHEPATREGARGEFGMII
jgi:hypothetical protein